jgi:hypothetical protein
MDVTHVAVSKPMKINRTNQSINVSNKCELHSKYVMTILSKRKKRSNPDIKIVAVSIPNQYTRDQYCKLSIFYIL